MTNHFQPIVKTVVLLVRAFLQLFNALQFERIFPFFSDLRYIDNAELKGIGKRIVFDNLFAEPQAVKIEDMRMAGIAVLQSAVALEKVRIPQREIAYIRHRVIRPNGIIR